MSIKRITHQAGWLISLALVGGCVGGGGELAGEVAGGPAPSTAAGHVPSTAAGHAPTGPVVTDGVDVGQAIPAPDAPLTLQHSVESQDAALPAHLVVGPTHVYWLTAGGDLMAVPKGGGTAGLLASDERTPSDLVMGGDTLYWLVTDDDGASTLLAISSHGGPVQTLATGPITQVSVDADAGELFWLEHDEDALTMRIVRAGLSGQAPVTVVTDAMTVGESVGFGLGPGAVVWVRGSWYQDNYGSSVHRLLRDGGQPEQVASSDRPYPPAGRVEVDGATVAWIDFSQRLVQLPTDRGAIARVDAAVTFRDFLLESGGLLGAPMYAQNLVVYGFADDEESGVTPSEVLYQTDSSPGLLAGDGDALVWAEWTSECTDERFEGKSAWCAAYRYEVQIVRARR